MSLSASPSHIGAILGIIGTALLLWMIAYMFALFSYPISNFLSHPERVIVLFLVLVLLAINGVALIYRLPEWLFVVRLVIVVCGLLLTMGGLYLGMRICSGYLSQGQHISFGDFFRGSLGCLCLSVCLAGLILNLLAGFLS